MYLIDWTSLFEDCCCCCGSTNFALRQGASISCAPLNEKVSSSETFGSSKVTTFLTVTMLAIGVWLTRRRVV